MMNVLKNRRGFTLIEMTIVLFIISLLILIIIPNISNARQHAQGVHNNAMVSVVQSQIDDFLEDNPNQQVSYGTLSDKGYLTNAQVHKAYYDDHIQIENNKAVKS